MKKYNAKKENRFFVTHSLTVTNQKEAKVFTKEEIESFLKINREYTGVLIAEEVKEYAISTSNENHYNYSYESALVEFEGAK